MGDINPENEQNRKSGDIEDILKDLNTPQTPQEQESDTPVIDDHNDRKSLKRFRENLLACEWARDDVYRISVKFFGRRSASELDMQFQKLLQSMHFVSDPKENNDLGLKVLLDEMTSTEAIKKSLLRKNAAEMRKALSEFGWTQGFIDQLVRKYAGEKTIEEITTKFDLILSELPYDSTPQENQELAVRVLLDSSKYNEAYQKAAHEKYVKTMGKMFEGIPQRYIDKMVEEFFGKDTPSGLFAKCEALNSEIKIGAYPKDQLLAVKVLVRELTKEEALGHAKSLKNTEDIKRLGQTLGLSDKTVRAISETYANPQSKKWFDDEFPRIFNMLPQYTGCHRENALLSAKVLSGQCQENEAVFEARKNKNSEAITKTSEDLSLSNEQTSALLHIYTETEAPGDFAQDYARIINTFPQTEALARSGGKLAVRVILKKVSEASAAQMAELLEAFNGYSIPEDDMDEIASRFLDKKTPKEILMSFESILDKLPFIDSREENYGLAIHALMEGGPEGIDAAIAKASVKKDRAMLQKSLNTYGWFSGYTSDLLDRFFPEKDAVSIIADFEKILEQLPYAKKPTDNYDLALKALLDKIQFEEALKEALMRKMLYGYEWTKDFNTDIARNYLGPKPPEDAIKIINNHLSGCAFWKRDPLAHKYAIEIILRELNGKTDARTAETVCLLLEGGAKTEDVKTIASAMEKAHELTKDAAELAARYAELRAKDPKTALADFLKEIK